MPAIINGATTEEETNTNTGNKITVEELASYGLTLDQFNAVRNSESPSDFGGLPSSGDTDQLWLDAAVFEYEVSFVYSSSFEMGATRSSSNAIGDFFARRGSHQECCWLRW